MTLTTQLLPAHADAATPAPRSPRLVSLDIVRGFTVATMIFVDSIGNTYCTLNHSPWDGITLADMQAELSTDDPFAGVHKRDGLPFGNGLL